MSFSSSFQNPYRSYTSITNWYEFYLSQDMMSAVPCRHGSECPNSALEAVVFITAPERGPEFLRDEYQKVRAQYLAIENLEARQAFLVERKQLVKRIKEAKLVFLVEINLYSRMYPSAC
jgi:hypothetical protein